MKIATLQRRFGVCELHAEYRGPMRYVCNVPLILLKRMRLVELPERTVLHVAMDEEASRGELDQRFPSMLIGEVEVGRQRLKCVFAINDEREWLDFLFQTFCLAGYLGFKTRYNWERHFDFLRYPMMEAYGEQLTKWARKFGFKVKAERDVGLWVELGKPTPRTSHSVFECLIAAIAPLNNRLLKFLGARTVIYDSIANREIRFVDHSTTKE